MQKATEKARSANCYKIMLLTGAKVESTLRFYEKCGFNRKDKTAFILWL
jgi:GNAT superfamily N-acetyltransferase